MTTAKIIANTIRRYFRIIQVPHDEPTKAFLEQCQTHSITLNDKAYNYYQKGSGPTVILIHGLHSNLGSMVPIAQDLIKHKFGVVLFDAPAHGEAPGISTNPVEARNVIRKIGSQFDEPHAIICHSLGGVWALSAWNESFGAKTLISISSPSNHRFLVEKFAELNQLDNEITEGLFQQMERRFGEAIWTEFSPCEVTKTIDIPGLIIHGENDDFVPLSHAKQLASNWDKAKLEMFDEASHFDIVKSPKVIDSITAYLQNL